MIEKTLCRLAAVPILVIGTVHRELRLWRGYRRISTIGPLFLLNAIAAAVIAAGLVWRGEWLLEPAGVGYAASTLAAFLSSFGAGTSPGIAKALPRGLPGQRRTGSLALLKERGVAQPG